jgi:hypothetical protein
VRDVGRGGPIWSPWATAAAFRAVQNAALAAHPRLMHDIGRFAGEVARTSPRWSAHSSDDVNCPVASARKGASDYSEAEGLRREPSVGRGRRGMRPSWRRDATPSFRKTLPRW